MKLHQALVMVDAVVKGARAGIRLRRRRPRRARRSRDDGRAAPDTRLNAQRKAYTAARSDAHSTRELAEQVAGDPVELASFDASFTFFKGGVAAFEDGRRVGAIGVSGLPGEEDERLALKAIAQAGLGPE